MLRTILISFFSRCRCLTGLVLGAAALPAAAQGPDAVGQLSDSAVAATFAAMRQQLDSALAGSSGRAALDAYRTFERVEGVLRLRDADLAHEIEAGLVALRDRAASAGAAAALDSMGRKLSGDLTRAEAVLRDRPAAAGLLAQSFLLLLREGLEAILVLAALLAFLEKAGAPERRRDVARGALAALAASGVTWAAVEWVFSVSSAQREMLEGGTMLLAAAVLFSVSYWLLSKTEAARWTAFVKRRMGTALAAGSGLALASVAFLAVYREGLETILFYQALFASADGAGAVAIATGMGAGALALAAVYAAVHWFGLRLPVRPFFAVTGALLYAMAFVFAGKGIAELQEAGVLGVTALEGAPRVPAMGIYPTAQSMALQAVFLALAVFAVVRLRWSVGPGGHDARIDVETSRRREGVSGQELESSRRHP